MVMMLSIRLLILFCTGSLFVTSNAVASVKNILPLAHHNNGSWSAHEIKNGYDSSGVTINKHRRITALDVSNKKKKNEKKTYNSTILKKSRSLTKLSEISTLSRHYQQEQEKRQQKQQQQQQQFVILAGPHKTASTTIQRVIIALQSSNSLDQYVWPHMVREKKDNFYHEKQFSILVSNLMEPAGESSHRGVKFYAPEFERIWSEGKSIVIGAELFGSSSISSFGSNVIDGLKEILPMRRGKESKESAPIVVLNFRSARMEHLISVWGQSNIKSRKVHNATAFSDWLCSMNCSLPEPKLNLNVINTLGQADAYRKANYKVVLVDMGGVERDGLNVAHIPACEILGVFCVDGVPEGLNSIKKAGVSQQGKRKRGGDPDISKAILQKITSILKRMDCSYDHLRYDENVHILHLSDMFSNCSGSEYTSNPPINDKQACSLIKHTIGCGHNETISSDDFVVQTNTNEKHRSFGMMDGDKPSFEFSGQIHDQNAMINDVAFSNGFTNQTIGSIHPNTNLPISRFQGLLIYLLLLLMLCQTLKKRIKRLCKKSTGKYSI